MLSFWVLALCTILCSSQCLVEMSSFSGLKMASLCFSEMLTSTYESTWYQNPEEHYHPRHYENPKSKLHMASFIVIYVIFKPN